jgi:hypothetical protein
VSRSSCVFFLWPARLFSSALALSTKAVLALTMIDHSADETSLPPRNSFFCLDCTFFSGSLSAELFFLRISYSPLCASINFASRFCVCIEGIKNSMNGESVLAAL